MRVLGGSSLGIWEGNAASGANGSRPEPGGGRNRRDHARITTLWLRLRECGGGIVWQNRRGEK